MGMLATLLAGLASGEAAAAARRARSAAIVYVLAAIAGLCGLGFLIGAAYVWVQERYGSLHASLGFAAGFMVLAGLILIVYKLTAGSRARHRARRRNADLTALGVTAALAALPAVVRGKGGIGLLAGPAIALVAYVIYKENTRSGPGERDRGEPLP